MYLRSQWPWSLATTFYPDSPQIQVDICATFLKNSFKAFLRQCPKHLDRHTDFLRGIMRWMDKFLLIKTNVNVLLSVNVSACAYLPPALGWHNPAHGHVNVSSSVPIMRGERTRQHCCVRVRQRSLQKDRQHRIPMWSWLRLARGWTVMAKWMFVVPL